MVNFYNFLKKEGFFMLFGKHVNKFYIKYGIFFLLGIIALIVVDFFQLEIPEIVGTIIDGLEDKSLTNKDTLKDLMLKLMGVAGVLFCGRFLWRVCIFGNGIRIESALRNDMFKHMEKLSQEYYFENYRKKKVTETTYKNDERRYNNYLKPAFQGKTLEKIRDLLYNDYK